MLQLFIDTSTERAMLGLAHNGELIEEVLLPMGLKNSKLLFPALLDLFDRQKITAKDISLISCGVGPGSYTGIRVGAATAQSMAYALRLPLIGVSSLESFAPQEEGIFAVLLDAKISGVYFQKGERKAGKVQFLCEPKAVPLEELEAELKGVERIVTPNKEAIQAIWKGRQTVQEIPPSGKLFAERAFAQYSLGHYSKKAELQLLYLRKTEAESNLAR
jgi:tRNA threonylcarbamoyladenosine biosynthesis protein TsaB